MEQKLFYLCTPIESEGGQKEKGEDEKRGKAEKGVRREKGKTSKQFFKQ